MMEVDYPDAAIVCNHEDRPIKLDAKQLALVRHVYRVVEERGSRKKSAIRAERTHPSQRSVGIENDR